MYHVTEMGGEVVWRHAILDFTKSKTPGRLTSETGLLDENEEAQPYTVEAGRRDERFIVFLRSPISEESAATYIFPYMGFTSFSLHHGVSFLETWDGTERSPRLSFPARFSTITKVSYFPRRLSTTTKAISPATITKASSGHYLPRQLDHSIGCGDAKSIGYAPSFQKRVPRPEADRWVDQVRITNVNEPREHHYRDFLWNHDGLFTSHGQGVALGLSRVRSESWSIAAPGRSVRALG
jgi:hypothetical protein